MAHHRRNQQKKSKNIFEKLWLSFFGFWDTRCKEKVSVQGVYLYLCVVFTFFIRSYSLRKTLSTLPNSGCSYHIDSFWYSTYGQIKASNLRGYSPSSGLFR